jgi:hypothetical protein
LIFVCWLFRGHGFDRKRVVSYGCHHARALAKMLKRNGANDLFCVSDQELAADCDANLIPMPREVAALPKYYPKLWAFSDDFGRIIGEKFVSIDLDAVVLGNFSDLLENRSEFAIWDDAIGEPYNSSLFVLEPGARAQVWECFSEGRANGAEMNATRWTGDQSWIAHVLGPKEERIHDEKRIIRYRPSLHREKQLQGVDLAFLCGPYDPASEPSPWIREAWG